MRLDSNFDVVKARLARKLDEMDRVLDARAWEALGDFAGRFFEAVIAEGPVASGELAGGWIKTLDALGFTAAPIQNRFGATRIAADGNIEPVGLSADAIARGKSQGEVEMDRARLSIRAVNAVPQALWVEEGTAPHVILPKGRRGGDFGPSSAGGSPVLVFFSPRAGATVWARRVEHPGTPAQKVLFEQALVHRPRLREMVRGLVLETFAAYRNV